MVKDSGETGEGAESVEVATSSGLLDKELQAHNKHKKTGKSLFIGIGFSYVDHLAKSVFAT